jgi:hypothetical protein
VLRNRIFLGLVLLAILLATATVSFVQRRRSVLEQSGPGAVITLGRGDDFQSALNKARPGDTIVLQAGAVYLGPFTLPAKSGNDFITIQSSRLAELPEGVRVSPSQSHLFAKLFSATNGEPIIKTEASAHHYKFMGIEFATTNAKVVINDLVRLGESRSQSSLESVPHHLVIDRSFIHGFPTQEVQRGISLNSAETSIINSHISDIHGRGYDTQAICGWNGPGPFKILNNYLEGAGENVMFGGSDPTIQNLVPSDIEIRNNHFFKPLSWKKGDPSFVALPPLAGSSLDHWSVKNLFELKSARRVVIESNVFENNWIDAQAGSAILFTVRNQDGGAPWSIIEDVVFRNNVVRNSPSALNLLGSDNLQKSQRARNLVISNNLFTGITGTFLTMSGYSNVTISHNTHFQAGNIMSLHGQSSDSFTYRANLTMRSPNGYGVKGDGTGEGTIALQQFAPGYSFRDNVIIGARASDYPANNHFPPVPSAVGFVQFEQGDYRLKAQSPYSRAADGGAGIGCNFALLPNPPNT